jgi:hypothetical protein
LYRTPGKKEKMTTITIHLPENETSVISTISDIVKNVKGGSIDIDNDDDGFTENELSSLKRSLKEAALIKKGELKPLSMNDLWDE